MQITDFRAFRVNYLTQRTSFRITDLALLLNDTVKNVLQQELAGSDIQDVIIPEPYNTRLRQALKIRVNEFLYGISLIQIVDITMNNEDFNRFRALERKLYCTERELDYLRRTNTYQNRLQVEENNRQILGAKTEEELRYQLMLLNKDRLLHDDEIEQFVLLLKSQKIIREAKNEEEVEKALLDIQGCRLVNQDDFEALKNELQHRKDARDEMDAILRLQRLKHVEIERIATQKFVQVEQIKADSEVSTAQYEADKKRQEQLFDMETDARHHAYTVDDENLTHEGDSELKRAGYTDKLVDAGLGTTRKVDDYHDERRVKEHKMGMSEAEDLIDLNSKMENAELDTAERAARLAQSQMAFMNKQVRTDVRLSHDIKMEEKRFEHVSDMDKRRLDADRERAVLEHDEKIFAQKASMTAEQLAAVGLTEMDTEAQKAYFDMLSSNKAVEIEREALKREAELQERMAQQAQDSAKDSLDRQNRMVEQMMGMMQETVKVNAGVVKDAVAGQQAQIQAQAATIERVATHRMTEVEADKKEARADREHAQKRLDETQTTALNYTAEVSSSRAQAEALGHTMNRPTRIEVICPNCGAKGPKGSRCSECNTELV